MHLLGPVPWQQQEDPDGQTISLPVLCVSRFGAMAQPQTATSRAKVTGKTVRMIDLILGFVARDTR
jgi:hypothetical protein